MMDAFAPRHLGFALPYDLMFRQGARDRSPGRGVCVECGKHRTRVYVLGDNRLYCVYCIHYVLANVKTLFEQAKPPVIPIETMWETVRAAGGKDDFNPEFWNKVLG